MPEAGTETRALARDCLNGLAVQPVDKVLRELEQLRPSHPAVSHGISTALLALEAKHRHLPLAQLLNKNARSEIRVNAAGGVLIDVAYPDLQQLEQQGFQVIKLKVGIAEPAAELTRLHELSRQLDPATMLRLDANQAWDWRQATYFIDGIQGLPIESLEEPLQTPTLIELGKLQSSSAIPLALDETLSRFDPPGLIRAGVVLRLVLKPMALGGMQPALAIGRQARHAGMSCVVTSVLESAAGIWAACHLAAAMEPWFPGLAHGLDTSRWLSGNTGIPPAIIQGRIALSTAAGSGFRPHAQYSSA